MQELDFLPRALKEANLFDGSALMLVPNRAMKTYPTIRTLQAEHQNARGVKKCRRASAGLFTVGTMVTLGERWWS